MSEQIITKGPITLIKGDITVMDTDAIVNPSYSEMMLGGGVSSAINERTGNYVQEELKKIGGCPVGGAVVTGAGNLKARYVIHAVGPKFGEGGDDDKLKKATLEALKRAEELSLKSITYPAISTGIFGFPMRRCATIMLSAVMDHFARGDNKSLEQVIFCLWDDTALGIFIETLDWLTPEGA